MKNISVVLDQLNATYAKIIQRGDFNVEQEEDMSQFLDIYELKKFFKQKTCNKSPENLPCIYLTLTNYYRSFQNTDMIQTRLSISIKLLCMF